MRNIKAFYDTHAGEYERFENEIEERREIYPLLTAMRKKERELLHRGKDKKVFYFAAGSGTHVLSLAQLGARTFTLDFSQPMITRTAEKLERAGIDYIEIHDIPEITASPNTLGSFLDNCFSIDPRRVIISRADIAEVALPENYFDHVFCYCTLPLVGKENIPETLEKLLSAGRNGAVSVYDAEKLPILDEYYRTFGYQSHVNGSLITIKGGFEYFCVPSSEVSQIIARKKQLKVREAGLGKIYLWSERV